MLGMTEEFTTVDSRVLDFGCIASHSEMLLFPDQISLPEPLQ